MKVSSVFVAVFLAALVSASAQQPLQLQVGDVDVKNMEVEVQKTPNFQAGDVKTKNVPYPKDWLEIEVEFTVAGDRNQVVPELLFRYYVAFTDQSGSGRVLTGDVKHINVPMGEETYSAVYVAPSTLGEITGDFRNFREGAVKAVGVEVYFNGVIVGGKSTESGSRAKFWQALGTSPGVLGRNETPFALLWIDRYAESSQNP